MSEINGADLALFIQLSEQKKLAQAEVKRINSQLAEMEGALLEQFIDAGVQNIKANEHTIYLHRRFVAKAKDGDRARAITALKSAGLEEYLTFNSQQITAYFKELKGSDATAPDLSDKEKKLVEAFEFDNIFSVRARKS